MSYIRKTNNDKMIKLLLLNLIIIMNMLLFLFLSTYCKKCKLNYNEICKYCPREIVFKGLNIASREETLNEIISNNKSIARFGDGEFKIIFGHGIGFHKSSKLLKNRLVNVLNSNLDNLMIGLNMPYRENELNIRPDKGRDYWKKYINKYKFKIINLLDIKKKYYSALVFRYTHIFKNMKKFDIRSYILKLRNIWDKRDILIIEGLFTRNGIGNDLFNNTNSIKRILCPAENAFLVYKKILNEFQKLKIAKDILILISLGPVASILSYDLCKMGYQALDIGHTDLEYEFYLRKYNSIKRIPYKYVNQAKDGKKNIQNITDQNYYKQILAKILS